MVYDRWKITNARRQTHNETGFFSPFSLPYKNFGKLGNIDVYDLLGDYLGIDISKHQAYVQVNIYAYTVYYICINIMISLCIV